MIAVVASAYGVIVLCAARLIAGHLAWKWLACDLERKRELYERKRELYGSCWNPGTYGPDGWSWFAAWTFALCLALVWPVIIFPWIFGRNFKVGAERNAILAARERRVRTLERELGIK